MTLNRCSHIFFVALVTLIATLLLAASVSKEEAQSSTQPASSAAPAATAETVTPVVTSSPEPEIKLVKHALGETKIPAHPQRIASINLEDMLLSLDVPLVLAVAGSDNYDLGDQFIIAIAGERP